MLNTILWEVLGCAIGCALPTTLGEAFKRFRPLDGSPAELRIHEKDLHYLYDSVLAFNRPVMNDPAFGGSLDFGAMERALFAGTLDPLLTEWSL